MFVSATCSETDDGLDYNNKGTTDSARFYSFEGSQVWTDICLKDYDQYQQGSYIPNELSTYELTEEGGLLEGTCTENVGDSGKIVTYECSYGCENGACKIPERTEKEGPEIKFD